MAQPGGLGLPPEEKTEEMTERTKEKKEKERKKRKKEKERARESEWRATSSAKLTIQPFN